LIRALSIENSVISNNTATTPERAASADFDEDGRNEPWERR
jgi:hypothetical protein